MRPSSKNLVMNGVIESYIYQKKLDESQGTSFADTWKAFNGANIALGDLYLDEGAFAMLSALKCTFGAFNCIFKDGSRGACLVWIGDGYVWAVEMKDEGALKAHKVDIDGKDDVFESDEGASAIITALLCVTNAVGGGTSEDAVTLDTKQTITGEKTFTAENGVGTDAIHNTDGNALVRYKKTEKKQVFGSSELPIVLMGSSDRPKYSKVGSDFDGDELALKSDVDINWYLLMSSLGRARYLNYILELDVWNSEMTLEDPLLPYYSNIEMIYMYANFTYTGKPKDSTVTIVQDFSASVQRAHYSFSYCKGQYALMLSNAPSAIYADYAFFRSEFTKVLFKTGVTPWKLQSYAVHTFDGMSNLTEIGAFDMSDVTLFDNTFRDCTSLKSIHCTHFKKSFSIADSTQFEESDLLEVINNLDEVTTTQTLTIGATNSAKLTEDDIAIATNKGWTVA